MAESTTKVGSSSTINIKMQSGVNLKLSSLVMEKLQVKLLGTLNKLKLRFWRKTLQIFSQALAGEIAGFV
jgi:hypothetical protein